MPPALYWFCRLFVGGILLASAVGKSLDLPGFIQILTTYRAFPGWTLWPIGLAIIGLEWMLAVSLLLGWRLRTGILVAFILNTGYAMWMMITLLRGLELTNCGCFGAFFPQPLRWYSPLEDLVLVGMCYALRRCVKQGSLPVDRLS